MEAKNGFVVKLVSRQNERTTDRQTGKQTRRSSSRRVDSSERENLVTLHLVQQCLAMAPRRFGGTKQVSGGPRVAY